MEWEVYGNLKQPSDNWNTVKVLDFFVRRGAVLPNNLLLLRRRGKKSKTFNIHLKWLPLPEKDWRANAGRDKNNKRLPYEISLETANFKEAVAAAVDWYENVYPSLFKCHELVEADREYSLHRYWEIWFDRECMEREKERNFSRWKRDTRLKWEGEGYGIKHQKWSLKPLDQIRFADFKDYWAVLNRRRTPTNDMGGTKKQQKTLIRALMKEARDCGEYPNLVLPDFPETQHQKVEADHLRQVEWDCLMEKVVELSGGAAKQELTPKQYQALDFKKGDRRNQRNWVDLYDALNLMWFFFLRAEDIPRLKTSSFEDKQGEIVCFLEEIKGNRERKRTKNLRPDALENWRRIAKRKPHGFLFSPHLIRKEGTFTDSTALKNLRFLLQVALAKCEPPIIRTSITPTSIRHTAFRLAMEEQPDLRYSPQIDLLASCGNTSVDQLQETYLRPILEDENLHKARKKFKPSSWSLMKRVA